MEEYVDFTELGLDMEVEVYDVSGKKVDTGIVTNVYNEFQIVVYIYSTEKGTFEVYPEDQDYNIKILDRDSKSAETAIKQDYVTDLFKDFKKHKYLMDISINHYESEKATLDKSLRAINGLSAQQRKYVEKIKDIEEELSYYGRMVDFYPEPKQQEDKILVNKSEFFTLQIENKELLDKLQELDDANGEGNKQCQCKQCKCSIGN